MAQAIQEEDPGIGPAGFLYSAMQKIAWYIASEEDGVSSGAAEDLLSTIHESNVAWSTDLHEECVERDNLARAGKARADRRDCPGTRRSSG